MVAPNVQALKVALIGCGQIADAHLQEIGKIPMARIVAVCDRHVALAKQAAARFGFPSVYSDVNKMLREMRPDVVHVTTPPHTHGPISLTAIAAGCHVYVEKPFAVDSAEATTILRAAEANNRLVCVGHDQLYDPAWVNLRKLYNRGDLGEVLHVDSIQGYDLDGPFGRTATSSSDHWIHRLPGGIFQNTMSHAMYKITEFLLDDEPKIWATWFGDGASCTSPTELRVMMKGERVTANLLFSSWARPIMRVARVYGTRKMVEVDLEGRVLRISRPGKLPGPFAKIEAPIRQLKEAAMSLGQNIIRLLRSDLQYFAGMKCLFEKFYKAIVNGNAPPVPYSEIVRVTAIMDRVIQECKTEQSSRVADNFRGIDASQQIAHTKL